MYVGLYFSAAMLANIPYLVTGIAYSMHRKSSGDRKRLRKIYWELRPFLFPGLGVAICAYALGGLWISVAVQAMFMYLSSRAQPQIDAAMRDDDDPWKRRKNKIKEKLQQVQGRLVPVPA